MKRAIIVATIVLGTACVGSAQAAIETYMLPVANAHGYAILGFVGHTPAEFAQARRQARMWEARRQLGIGPLTVTAMAVDASSDVARTGRPFDPRSAIAAAAEGR
jgi:hypothetical protein